MGGWGGGGVSFQMFSPISPFPSRALPPPLKFNTNRESETGFIFIRVGEIWGSLEREGRYQYIHIRIDIDI